MAKSRYEYVKSFEQDPILLPRTWVVIRIDGQSFTRFCKSHSLQKPNDIRCISTMNKSAQLLCRQFSDIVLAYGQSDEYSFVLSPESSLFNRRQQKIISSFVSFFTSSFVLNWPQEIPLQYPPSFDCRTVCYPGFEILHDYLRWRQADCHINNLNNTLFWAIVQSGKSEKEAHAMIKGTNSGQKNEMLFGMFGINYNNEPEVFRKGTVMVKPGFEEMHRDIFHKEFFLEHNILV
jgi:tRNA(His) guanylyltransferase